MLSSVYHSGPVTALACVEGTILAGIGSRLHVYRLQPTVQHLGTYSILPGRVIHGVRQEQCSGLETVRLCVFGQKCLRVVQFDPGSGEVKASTDLVQLCDWIWDVAWLQGGDKLSLALGHNTIVIWDITSGTTVKTTHCSEKCILYCARFLTSQEDMLILAAGTVFNQVVLWSPSSEPDQQGHVEPFHTLTGHQGVIFSVDYDPVCQRICSVSDDRSIRLYQMTFPQADNDFSLTSWENVETSLIHVLYGHSARVWDVKLLSRVFVSVGEDATCCVWNYDGEVIQKLKGHKGKSIWSMAVDKKEEYLVTGGGDNSIRLWNLQADETDISINTQVLELPLNPEDFPRSVQFLSDGQVLSLTNEGVLLCSDTATTSSRGIMKDDSFASYSVLAVSPDRQTVAMGNIHGTLRLLCISDRTDHKVLDTIVIQGRIYSIIWLDCDHILTSQPDGEMNVWQIIVCDDQTSLGHISKFELPVSKHRWASAAAFSQDRTHVICGDRAGSVILYHMDGQLLQMFPRIHKADVTQICLHGNHVYTTGRDGIYRQYEWGDDQLTLLNSSKVFKGFSWIERLTFTEDGDLLIQGFNANKFIMWSVQQNQKLIEVESGGGHRSWDFLLTGCHDNKAKLLYIKAREVIVKDIQMRSNQVIVKSCLHGRELCDVRHISTSMNKLGQPVHILATCSEDTMVCLSAVKYNKHCQQDLDMLHSLSGHISSVRCLAMCESSMPCSHDSTQHRKLLFSAGGRAQIKIWRLDIEERLETLMNLPNEKTMSHSVISEPQQEIAKQVESTGQKHSLKDSRRHSNSPSVIPEVSCDRFALVENVITLPIEDLNTISDVELKFDESCSNCDSSHIPNELKLDSDLIDNSVNKNPGARTEERNCSKNMFKTTVSDSRSNQDRQKRKIDGSSSLSETESPVSCQYESLAGVQLGSQKRRNRKPWRVKEDNSDPETRILDLTVFCAHELSPDFPAHLFFLTAACSDGLIRLFLFEEDSREVTLIAFSNFHNHCVLKVKHVVHRSEQKAAVLIVSAATDGRAAFWDITDTCKSVVEELVLKAKQDTETTSGTNVFIEKKVQSQHTVTPDRRAYLPNSSKLELEDEKDNEPSACDHKDMRQSSELVPVCSLLCHQSGINSIFFGPYGASSKYILLTGGDDNAIQVSMIMIETLVGKDTGSSTEVKVICSGSELNAHAAQVTGIWYLGSNMIVTASIDQRVCVWSVIKQESKVKLELQDCKFVDVPDIANVDVWRLGNQIFMAVCGEGLEILEINIAALGTS